MGKVEIIKSLFWKLTERTGVQIINMIISVILARLLVPADYGIISLTGVFISISNVLIQSGMSSSLLQKKRPDKLDYSTALVASLFISILIYLSIFLFSPMISNYFSAPYLTIVLRVLSLKIIFDAVYSIQNAYASKNLYYNRIFISSMFATGISGFIGVYMAFSNYGVWALVAQQLIFSIFNSIIMITQIGNIFSLNFSISRFKGLFSFGSDIMISDLIDSVFLNIRSVLIGRFFTANILGYFTKGRQFPERIITNLNGSIQSVMLVAYSEKQEDTTTLKKMLRRSMSISAFVIFPIMIGLTVIAEPLVFVLLTEKWSGSIIYIQIASLTFMWMPIHTANIQIIKAMGESRIILRLQMVRKFIEIIILMISIEYGVIAIALGELVSTLISFAINLYPNKRLINYGPLEQVKDILPALTASTIMGVLIYQLNYLDYSNLIILLLQIIIGTIIYLLTAKIFKINDLDYVLNTGKDLLKMLSK